MLGWEDRIAIERKSLQDMIACVTYERDRFKRELERLLAYKHRALVIEAHMSQVLLKQYSGQANPRAILNSIHSFGLQANMYVAWVGAHSVAGKEVAEMLWVAARKCHAEDLAAS